jgi:hypothetical protein
MSCNSCSNVTLPGVQGPAGANGAPGAPGDNGNGIVSITLDSSVGNVDTYEITYTDSSPNTFNVTNGNDGNNGVSLINTITAPVAVSATSYSSANAIGGTPWSVPLNTLKDTGDTLRIELTVLPTFVDGGEYANVNIEVGGQVVHLWTVSPYDLTFEQNYYANIQVDLIKTSDTTLRVEFLYSLHPQFFSDYANNLIMGGSLVGSSVFSFARSNQTITVPSLITNNTDVDIQMKVSDATYPAKLLIGKLYFFKKL